jgi:hypothetical protein
VAGFESLCQASELPPPVAKPAPAPTQ